MKILIVAATSMEVKLLTEEMDFVSEKSNLLKQYRLEDKETDVLLTGIGTTFTTFHLTQTLIKNKYDLVLSVGIAGSLSGDLQIGEVVNVISDEFADLGIEDKSGFLTLFESGFVNINEFPFVNGQLKAGQNNGFISLKKVNGITTNKSHGKSSSIAELQQKFSAQVETMEGAAVFYVCNQLDVPCYQIRAISNYIEPCNLIQWNIPLALENLKIAVIKSLKNLEIPVS
ncbi:MAG: futalosine hydrolase [Prolixibacteraceae bacterium]